MFTIYAKYLSAYTSSNNDFILVVNIDYDDAIAVTPTATLRAFPRNRFIYRSHKDSEFLRLWLNCGQRKISAKMRSQYMQKNIRWVLRLWPNLG